MDKIDLKILNYLQEDGLMSAKEIAKEVGLSVSPTYDRINKLKKDGVIEKFIAVINREKVGKQLLVMCTVTLRHQSGKSIQDFERSVTNLPEVIEVLALAGGADYMLKIAIGDVSLYHSFVTNKLAVLPEVANLSSNFIIKELKKNLGVSLL